MRDYQFGNASKAATITLEMRRAMRNDEKLAIQRARASAMRSAKRGISFQEVTITKEHAMHVSRSFYESRNDKENYEFVCAS